MANKFDHLTATERGSAPATPATSDWGLYFKSDGLYVIDDAGTEIGPLGTGDGGGGGGTGTALIEEIDLATDAASVTFDAIPGTFRDLLIVARIRTDKSSSDVGQTMMNVGNGTIDSGASAYAYATFRRTADASNDQARSAAATAIELDRGCTPGAGSGAVAGRFGAFEIRLHNYAETGYERQIMTDSRMVGGSAAATRTGTGIAHWTNTTDAIDIITLTPDASDNFVTGCTFALYGVK
jgi:hypothetical protein